ncbi:4Fe-4S dicluster domain-containing protein [Deinococcus sp.]|uniref:4Fe-4S dicluster domain-containing protein n=1 Tax=Deinococcus sp. TaxID=47478 RepID=UPI0025C506F8|nr:4Fe-4S dicluster domain-containing protein [Deinococcus sp.]
MLRGVLEQLGELGNLVPRYTQPRCLLVRQAAGGCDICQTICPHTAIELAAGSFAIEIDHQRCTGCGLCMQGCPTGALEYDLQTSLQAVQDQRGEPEATLTCSQSGAGGPQLPCLGRVTPALLSAAGAWNQPLTLIHGACEQCSVGSAQVPQQVQEAMRATQRLRSATGRPAQITLRAALPEDSSRALNVSRRGAFGTLLRMGQKQVVQNLPERPLPFVDWSEPAQRTPGEWRWRKQTLKPAPPPDVAVYWPAPVVDDSCIDCPVCANVCPTEAITRELSPEGGVRLLLDLSACTGCMACLRSCPPQAIHEQRQWFPAALEAQILLRESDSVM